MSTDFHGECLDFEVQDGVLEVRLHRAPANEIGLAMLLELERVAEAIRGGAGGAHAVLFCSEIERGFSAGADLRELHAGLLSLRDGGGATSLVDHARRLFDRPSTAAIAGAAAVRTLASRDFSKAAKVWGVRAFLDRIHRVFDTFDTAAMPTIAAVHGVCFGGGFELALTADVIVADKTARFAFPELRLGLIPGFGGIPRLERDLGNAVIARSAPERPEPRRPARARDRAGRAARRQRPRAQGRAPAGRADGPLRSAHRHDRQALPQALPPRAARSRKRALLRALDLRDGGGGAGALRLVQLRPRPTCREPRFIPMSDTKADPNESVLDTLLSLAATRFRRDRATLNADRRPLRHPRDRLDAGARAC